MLNRFVKKQGSEKEFEIEDSIMTITEKEEAIIETPYKRQGLNILFGITFFILLIIGVRVFYLDFFKFGYYSDISRGNRIRSIMIKAPRGKIIDKSGTVLVRNVPSVDVVIIPNKLPQDQGDREKIANDVALILGMEKGNVETAIESQNRELLEPVLLKENITEDQALIISEKFKELKGIELENTAIRNYENSIIFSSIIGYDGKITKEELNKNPNYKMTDYIGKTGIEKQYENDLRGINGARQVEVDSNEKVKKELGIKNSIPGNDLTLNIDEGLQKKLYDSISSMLEQTGTKTAAAVAINPQNGAVLALVSFPSFDNNLFAQGISNDDYAKIINDKNLPLFNRAVNGEYPPGSTLKPAIATAALSEGVITPETMIDGLGGNLTIGNFHFGDWKAHGPSDVQTAIAQSNDIFFYTVGGGYGNIQGLGMSRMKKYENLLGFGSPTGIDLPSEADGFIPDEDWKLKTFGERWYVGDSYHCAIGQGFVTVTPLQLANYAATIANGGTLYVPQIVNEIKNPNGTDIHIQPQIIRSNFISPDVMQVVRAGMRQVVTDGTAQPLKDLPVAVAGKTGTAQFGTENKTHAWFISFAPYDNPQIALVVLFEGGGEGFSSAVPITKDVYNWYFGQKENSGN